MVSNLLSSAFKPFRKRFDQNLFPKCRQADVLPLSASPTNFACNAGEAVDYRPKIYRLIKKVLKLFYIKLFHMGPITKTKERLELELACSKSITWIDATVTQLKKTGFQDEKNRDLILTKLVVLRKRLIQHDRGALDEVAAFSIPLSFLLDELTKKTNELEKLKGRVKNEVSGSPENIALVNTYITNSFEIAKRIETAIAHFVSGKTKEVVGIEENAELFDGNTAIAIKFYSTAIAFQSTYTKTREKGLAVFDELIAAVNAHYSNKRERDEKLRVLDAARSDFKRDFLKLEGYKLLDLVTIEDQEILINNDSKPMQLLNSSHLFRAYNIAWQELAQALEKEKDPQKLRLIIDIAKASVKAQIEMLRYQTTVRATDEQGRIILDENSQQTMRNLLPKEVTEKLVQEQLLHVYYLLERAEKNIDSGLEPQVHNFEATYVPAIERYLMEAAEASYDANEEMGEVVGKYMTDYLREEEDKIGFGAEKTRLQRIGFWFKSRGERYGEYAADGAVIGLGIVAIVASGGTVSPVVLAVEAAYWGYRGGQTIARSYEAKGELSASDLASGVAMMIPSFGALGLKLIPAGTARTTIAFTTAGASVYIIGSGVYGIGSAITDARKYGLTGSDIEAIASGAIFLGLGLKGRWVAKKILPKRTIKPVKVPTKISKQKPKTFDQHVDNYLQSDLLNKISDADKRAKIARALAIIRVAQERASEKYGREIKIFLIGGTVRDLLMGRIPKDLDLIVSEGEILFYSELKKAYLELTGTEVRVKKLNIFYISTEAFSPDVRSIEAVKGEKGKQLLEIRLISGLGKHYGKEGPDIPAILTHDASLRDLTINSLYAELGRFDIAGVVDPTGRGIVDINDNIVRFNDETKRLFRGMITGSVKPDLNNIYRLFRAYDFAGRTNATIEAETRQLIKDFVNAASSNPLLISPLKLAFKRALKSGTDAAPRMLRGLEQDGLLAKMPEVEGTISPILKGISANDLKSLNEYLTGKLTIKDLNDLVKKTLFSVSIYNAIKRYAARLASLRLDLPNALDFLMEVGIKDVKEVRILVEMQKRKYPIDSKEFKLLDKMTDALGPDKFFALDKLSIAEARKSIKEGRIKPEDFDNEKNRIKRDGFAQILK